MNRISFTCEGGPLNGIKFQGLPIEENEGEPQLIKWTEQKAGEGTMVAQGRYALVRQPVEPLGRELLEGEPPPPQFILVAVHSPSEDDREFEPLPEPPAQKPVEKKKVDPIASLVAQFQTLLTLRPPKAKELRPRYVERLTALKVKNPEELLDGPNSDLH